MNTELTPITYEESLKATEEYFNGENLPATVWVDKYNLKDSEGNLYETTPDDTHWRLATEFERIDAKYKNPMLAAEYYDLMKDFKYLIPQGSPMAGIGNNLQIVSLSNCFVIGNEGPQDSYGAVLKIDEEQIQLMKRRGGVGSDLSNIRPAESPVKNSALTSTGIVPFMERYSNSTREVAQAGRRGARMLSIFVHHPESENFIDAKMEQGKVTGANISVKLTDDFMEIVDRTTDKDVERFLELENIILEEYQEKKIPKRIENEFSKLIDKICFTQYYDHIDGTRQTQSIVAKALWDKIMHNAWKSAEPGVLFWDKITSESLAEHYPGFNNISTNPCLTGETMVAVADGRGNVSIKDLAEEGKDVPVYTYNNEGKVVVKLMRNPRLTGTKEKVYKLTLDDGSIIRATANHKFKTRSGEYKRMDALKNGDSLYIMSRYKEAFKNVIYGYDSKNSNNSDYWWIAGGGSNKSEHRLISQYYYGDIKSGYVVHHKDHNSLNNNINNLELMSVKEHNKYHANLIKGENNPYHKMTDDWKHNFASMPGETNPNYSGISNEQIKNEILEKTKSLGRVMYINEYKKLAREKGLPLGFSKWRKENLGELKDLLSWAADACKVLNEDLHPKVLKRYKEAIDNGYKPYIDTNSLTDKIKITKKCEICGNDFSADYGRREYAVCSNECSKKVRIDSFKKTISNKDSYYTEKTKQKFENERIKKREQQAKIVSDLRFSLQRDPKVKEFIEEAKKQNVVHRLGKNSPFRNWTELKEASLEYNHKVVSVEFDGYEDVYNGTVDEFHNFFVGGFESTTKNNKQKFTYINNLNCGELPLPDGDSCRLSVINLYSYVQNKFTDEAYFDFELFKKHSHIHQRIMDNIVDLELEKIDQILAKIEADPESEEIKYREYNLWKRLREKCEQGRRTGSGVTGEGDMLAAMGLKYGTPEATEFAEEVHKVYAIEILRSSVQLAKERGHFPIFDLKYEQNNPFIERIEKEDSDLIKDMRKYGRRNIGLLTIAPVGSISILTQTTSGVECAFMINYTRRRKINPSDKNTRVDFVDEVGDSWQNYNVFHKAFIDWFEANQRTLRSEIDNTKQEEKEEKYTWNECKSYLENLPSEQVNELIEKSPYYGATSNDVNWVEKVKMQGAIQKWIDHSISVTTNLPKDTPESVVHDVYMTAWKAGCKGATIYVDGSRSGVLVTEEDKKETEIENYFKENHAPRRPKVLEADVHNFTNKGEKWVAFIGKLEDKPYEIFTGPAEEFQIPSSIENGEITRSKDKDGESVYNFCYEKDGEKICAGDLKKSFDSQFSDVSRMVSALLRHGMPMFYIVNLLGTLNLDGDLITTWKKGAIRILKKYIKEDYDIKGATCQNCGSTNIAMQESCLICRDCGSSKCG